MEKNKFSHLSKASNHGTTINEIDRILAEKELKLGI